MLHLLFLQGDSLQPVSSSAAPVPATDNMSVFTLLKEGGPLMIPLLLCSILVIYVFVERYLAIRKATPRDPNFMNRVREQMLAGNLMGARSISRAAEGPVAVIISKGLSRVGKPIDHIEKSMETTGKIEIDKLVKNTGILSTIASIAPIFGFLGTLVGMLILFYDIQHESDFRLQTLAGGIYTKIITSIVGLLIGLLSYVAYKFLNAQIDRVENRMDVAAAEFVDILQEPVKA